MLGLGTAQRYWAYTGIADMRKGIDGLCGLITNHMGASPICGDVFVFFSRHRQRVKLLVWDQDGYVMYVKRLERGTFEKLDNAPATNKSALKYEQLMMILRGINTKNIRYRKRYNKA